jgi:ABC-type nitrate/sulfonate/bicarbonate transport system permease component
MVTVQSGRVRRNERLIEFCFSTMVAFSDSALTPPGAMLEHSYKPVKARRQVLRLARSLWGVCVGFWIGLHSSYLPERE